MKTSSVNFIIIDDYSAFSNGSYEFTIYDNMLERSNTMS